jgi:hypothetical protein
MQNITLSIPHQLGRAEAKRRIQAGIGQAKVQYGQFLQQPVEQWNGDTLDFSGRVMGQPIAGKVVVEDQAVRLELPLPWPLAMLVGGLTPLIEQQGRKLLAGPKAG